jgi:hypothetical protein
MKYFRPTILIITATLITASASAQQVNDMVSIGAGYPNQSFYSMYNGEVSNISNTDWDLAFQITGFQATIRINGKNNVRLFRAGLDVNAWSNVTAMDTVGKLNPAYELFDHDTSWWVGAFNATNDTSNQFDLGWGVYDFATHVVTGDSLYFIKLSNGVVKKLWIQSLMSNVYYFAYADVDGTNEVNATLNKTTYANRNFGYYSIINGTESNREPNKNDWDLTFCQYMAVTPITYKVTGVLANDSVFVARAYPVDVTLASFSGQSYTPLINTIGYDWKTYDFGSNSWLISDSLVYFVQDRTGDIWKMIFTGFGGSANGDYEFSKEPVSATGLADAAVATAVLSMYPNPANELFNIVYAPSNYDASNRIEVYSVTGQLVKSEKLEATPGLKETPLNISDLKCGLYLVRISIDGKTETRSLSVSH